MKNSAHASLKMEGRLAVQRTYSVLVAHQDTHRSTPGDPNVLRSTIRHVVRETEERIQGYLEVPKKEEIWEAFLEGVEEELDLLTQTLVTYAASSK